ELPRELPGQPGVVGVEERDPFAARGRDAGVARGRPARRRTAQRGDLLAVSREHRGRRVGGAVVDHDQLERGPDLRERAVDRARHEAGAIAHGDHAGDARSRTQAAGTFSRIVTNSSAAVGWMPIVASNCALVAPHTRATAIPWMISPAWSP